MEHDFPTGTYLDCPWKEHFISIVPYWLTYELGLKPSTVVPLHGGMYKLLSISCMTTDDGVTSESAIVNVRLPNGSVLP